MSGHSKWHSIRHKKAAVDARKGKLFAKLIRAIEVAARQGGGDPETNPALAQAVHKGKDAQMPNDTIDRAIKRGTGELEGVSYENVTYEGYAPGGVAMLVEVLTDNRNRAASDVRRIFTKHGGSLGEPGSVAWMFTQKGVVYVPRESTDEDDLLAVVIDVADEVKEEGDTWMVSCDPRQFHRLQELLRGAGVPMESAQLTMEPSAGVPLDRDTAKQVLRLMEDLEEADDVQEVYSNFDVDDEVLAEVAG